MSRGKWRREAKQKAARQVVDADPVLSLADIDPVIMATDPIKIETYIGPRLVPVTEADIELLPPSIRSQIAAVTRARKALRMPDNLRERQAAAVRAFKGDRPR